jgi:hypothetical protein
MMNRQEAIEIQTVPVWRSLVGEMEKVITMDIEKLLTAEGPDVVRLQEHIKAMRQCIRLPVVISEREE